MENEKNRLTSLAYWFPKIENLGIPVPKTILISSDNLYLSRDFYDFNPVVIEKIKEAGRKIGYPLFMRTDLCAGKHDWKHTCYVPNEDVIEEHLSDLLQYNEMADIMGLPYKFIVLREFLNLETNFVAFPGDMPINKERRYFIRNGEVICHHPYWPKEAFEDENSLHVDASQRDWKTKLEELNKESPYEVIILSSYAQAVAEVLSGFWSVDFAKALNGKWYLIDMAVGEASYHWLGCENKS